MSELKTNYQILGCMGCGVCENNNPDIFRLNNDGFAEAVDRDKFSKFDIENAGWDCPVSAISK